MGTGGSRSTTMSGGAIVAVSDKIIAKGKKLAAHLLEASEGDVEFKDGRFTISGTDSAMGIHEVAKAAFQLDKLPTGMEPGLYGPRPIAPAAAISLMVATSARSRSIPRPAARGWSAIGWWTMSAP